MMLACFSISSWSCKRFWVSAAAFRAGSRALPSGPSAAVTDEWIAQFRPLAESLDKQADRIGEKRKRRNDLFYAKAARVYVSLQGRNRTEQLADDYTISRSTARGWVSIARDRGLLSGAPKGRAGGELTQKAVELLEQEED